MSVSMLIRLDGIHLDGDLQGHDGRVPALRSRSGRTSPRIGPKAAALSSASAAPARGRRGRRGPRRRRALGAASACSAPASAPWPSRAAATSIQGRWSVGSSSARRSAERSARAKSRGRDWRGRRCCSAAGSAPRGRGAGAISVSSRSATLRRQAGMQRPAGQLRGQHHAALAERVERQRPLGGLDAQQEVAGKVDAAARRARSAAPRRGRTRPAPPAGPCGAARSR